MNMALGLRTLALLAVVALATAALVHPRLLLGPDAAPHPALNALPSIGRN
ncbi:hypothetical protein [uncultured Massilia sp.]|nr:hypothetical protein [uncultured Massilia sp.]